MYYTHKKTDQDIFPLFFFLKKKIILKYQKKQTTAKTIARKASLSTSPGNDSDHSKSTVREELHLAKTQAAPLKGSMPHLFPLENFICFETINFVTTHKVHKHQKYYMTIFS